MKSTLLNLSLLTASGLLSAYDYEPCCACCETCCVPEPEPCIDCVCYTPQFYELQCDWGAFVSLDFLYWYARESNLAYALKVLDVTISTPGVAPEERIFAPKNYEHLDTKWDPGVRLGLGWNSECDGWDYYLTWTYFHNTKSDSVSVPNFGIDDDFFIPAPGEFALINPWLNGSLSRDTNVQTFTKIKAKWTLSFNSIDLELGRKYWLSPCFTLRPYAGLRGAWTSTNFRTKSTRTFDTISAGFVDQDFKDRFKNRYWGVGFFGGLQPNWYFCQNFIFFANLDAALIWGKAKMTKDESFIETEDTTLVINYKNDSRDSFYKMQAILDLAIGLRWEECWCCDRYRTALDLGWEHHIWFNHNTRTKTVDQFELTESTFTSRGFRNFEEVTDDTMFGGFVLRGRFDF